MHPYSVAYTYDSELCILHCTKSILYIWREKKVAFFAERLEKALLNGKQEW